MFGPPQSATFEVRALAMRDSNAQLTQLMHRAYQALAARGMNLTAATQTEAETRARTLSGQTFVALLDGELVGTVTVCSPMDIVPGSLADSVPHYKDSGVSRFHQYAVDPRCQGKGLGRLLLRQAEDWATTRGYLALATDMAEGATELCAFYRHMGYRPIDHVQWPGKTYRSVLFRKDLQQSSLRAPLLLMARHHLWATRRVLLAVEALDDAEYGLPQAPGLGDIHGTLSRWLASEREVWWPRLSATALVSDPAATPAETDRRVLASRLHDAAAAWIDLIEAWPQDRLHGQLRFEQGPGEPDMLSMAEALLHMFDHASHQRGRICAAFMGLGRPVPPLDVVAMLHEEAQRP